MRAPQTGKIGTIGALRSSATSQLGSRLSREQSRLFSVYRYLPYPLVRVLPFIREDVKQRIQEWQAQRLSRRTDDEAESAVADIDIRLSAPRTESLSPYPLYRCPEQPLACSYLLSAIAHEADISHCPQCGFPALLQENAEIRGRRGRYRVNCFLQSRGLGRLYAGQDVTQQQPVVIREYVLPRQYFSSTEQQLTRDIFETIAGLKLADGREQDFRIVEPRDAVGDRQHPERCYLITTGPVDTYPTLRSVLSKQGALRPSQVRKVLNQALQTLESLHGQKYTLPAGQIQTGLVHGNLTLDSIVMLPDADSYYEQPQLLIFLRDLSLWESLFKASSKPTQVPKISDDLTALGRVGLYLLLGYWTDEYGRRLKPQNLRIWPGKDLPLEQYVRQLLGLDAPIFESAQAARQALLRLPSPPGVEPTPTTAILEEPARKQRPLWFWLLLLGVLGLIGAALFGWWWSRRQAIASQAPTLCCIKDVSTVPPGQFTYAAERQGTWYPLWVSKNLVTQNQTLEQVLEAVQPDLDLQLEPVSSYQAAIDQILQDTAEFAIAPVPDNRPTANLTVEPVAYDGLVAFVAFSYVERDRGLPHHLRGQLSLDQLRQLYTGEILNWQELGGPDLLVKLYLPEHPDLVRIFEQRVLQTPEAIQSFRRHWGLENLQTSLPPTSFVSPPSQDAINGETLPTLEMLQQILQDFEADSQVGSIGFASLSQIYSQCSVYPLAIATNSAPAIQPFYQLDDTPISPESDLCGDKGNYAPKQSLFAERAYPLAYPLAVLYRPDNSRVPVGPAFAQMFTTDEGQQMLSKTGLVPLRNLQTEDDR